MIYLISTIYADLKFGDVTVKGGAGVADRRTLITPKGVVTAISADQLERLKNNRVFQQYVDRGNIVVSRTSNNPDKVAKNMRTPAKGKQHTEKTIKSQAKPKKK